VTRTIQRPAAGSTGAKAWATGFVQISAMGSDGKWVEPPVATSWPSVGIARGGVAVIPQNATSAPLPSSQGASLAPLTRSGSAPTGGLNTGYPDSVCTDAPLPPSPAPGDVSTNALGGMPALYEVGAPTGEFAGQAPKGVMMLVHGGSWYVTGQGGLASLRGDANRWRARGWQTVNLTYRGCGKSILDVVAFFDRIRAVYPGKKVCALGSSAGAHLVMLLAGVRPDLACAIGRGTPTDLDAAKDESAYNPANGTLSNIEAGRREHNWAVAAFGLENLAWYSPTSWAAQLKARILLASAGDDAVIPWQQTLDLRDAVNAKRPSNYVDTVRMQPGSLPWVHGTVSPEAWDDYLKRELRVVEGI
jgi:hypothetical protein